MCGHGLRVGLGDQGPGFPSPESQLVEDPLALADPHLDLILCFKGGLAASLHSSL